METMKASTIGTIGKDSMAGTGIMGNCSKSM